MAGKDYYAVLKLKKSASTSEIRRAYRKSALECHPDHHPDDPEAEERFKGISEAYSVLGDVQKRKEYDLGHHPRDRASNADEHDDMTMGHRARHARRENRQDPGPKDFAQNTILGVRLGQIIDLELTPEEARYGTERFVLVTVGRRREGYRVRIPGGLGQRAQFKAILGMDESRYIFVRTRIASSAHQGQKA
jgi:curved DNA-binding protein CbpA